MENERLRAVVAKATKERDENALIIQSLEKRIRSLDIRQQVRDYEPPETPVVADLVESGQDASTVKALHSSAEHFYTPSSDRCMGSIDSTTSNGGSAGGDATPQLSNKMPPDSHDLNTTGEGFQDEYFPDSDPKHVSLPSERESCAEHNNPDQELSTAVFDVCLRHPLTPRDSSHEGSRKRKRTVAHGSASDERQLKRLRLSGNQGASEGRTLLKAIPEFQSITPLGTLDSLHRKRKHSELGEVATDGNREAKRQLYSLHTDTTVGQGPADSGSRDSFSVALRDTESPCNALLGRRRTHVGSRDVSEPYQHSEILAAIGASGDLNQVIPSDVATPVSENNQVAYRLSPETEATELRPSFSQVQVDAVASLLNTIVASDAEEDQRPETAPTASYRQDFLLLGDDAEAVDSHRAQAVEISEAEGQQEETEKEEAEEGDEKRQQQSQANTGEDDWRLETALNTSHLQENVLFLETEVGTEAEAEAKDDHGAQIDGTGDVQMRENYREENEREEEGDAHSQANTEEDVESSPEEDNHAGSLEEEAVTPIQDDQADVQTVAQASATKRVTAKRVRGREHESKGKLPTRNMSGGPGNMSRCRAEIASSTPPAAEQESPPADRESAPGQEGNMTPSQLPQDGLTPALENKRQKNHTRTTRRHYGSSTRIPTPESNAEDTTPTDGQVVGQDALSKRIDATNKSYQDFGFKINLVFRAEFLDFDPCGVSLGKLATQTTLNEHTFARLKARVMEVKSYVLRLVQDERSAAEVNLPRRLLLRKSIHPGHSSPEAVSDTIYRQRKGCKDEMNLCDFEMYSGLIILRAVNRQAVCLHCLYI